jgi:hypothetical protein
MGDGTLSRKSSIKPWPVFYNTGKRSGSTDEEKLLALAKEPPSWVKCSETMVGSAHARMSIPVWAIDRQPTEIPEWPRSTRRQVKSLGMEFSLWIEPENVNLNARSIARIDWVYGFPTRTPSIQRESLILNLGRRTFASTSGNASRI